MVIHSVQCHHFADDNQLYSSFSIADITQAYTQIEQCVNDIKDWLTSHFLKLTWDKTEFQVIRSPYLCQKVLSSALMVGQSCIGKSERLRNTFDSYNHATRAACCSYLQVDQLNKISKIRKSLSTGSGGAAQVIHVLVPVVLLMWSMP